jgi:hypothetical protein
MTNLYNGLNRAGASACHDAPPATPILGLAQRADATSCRRARILIFVLAVWVAAPTARGVTFLEYCAARAADAARSGRMAIQGLEGWWFLDAELRHLAAGTFWGERAAQVSRATKPEYADPLPAILDFRDQLKSLGVDLLMVPVPAKATVYPEFLCKECDQPEEAGHADRVFIEVLRKEGVSVVDLQPVFLENRAHAEGPLFCRQDSHWSGVGCVVAAQEIAKYVPAPLRDFPKTAFEWREIEITGDLWMAAQDPALPKEKLRVRRVGFRRDQDLEPAADSETSRIILLGDSHNLVFHAGGDMFDRGAGLADQLVHELGTTLDVVAVRGSGATPVRINLLRRAQKNPAYWNNKKLVIWCFSVREFTQSDGWRKVPIKAAPSIP